MNETKNKLEENPVVSDWLDTKQNEGTRRVYLNAMVKFFEFSQLPPEELKEEINKEFGKPLTERRAIEKRLRRFYLWMTEESDLSEKLSSTYIGALMSFYRHYNYRCNISVTREFKPTRKNPQMNLTVEDVRKLANHSKNLRDRAIILTLYQSGMDVSTLCSLRIRDIWKGLEENQLPLRITLTRPKEKIEYNTFLATDAIEAVRAYLLERRRKEGKLKASDHLFVKEWKKTGNPSRMKTRLISKFFRQLAVETGLTTEEEIKEAHWNVAHPHALRRAFADTLRVAGVNEQTIDYMLGHKLRFGGAYFGEAFEQYKNAMDKLAVFGSTEEVVNIRLQSLEEEVKVLKNQLTNVLIEELHPTEAVNIREATKLKEILLRAKDDPEYMDYAIDLLDEQIREAKIQEVPVTLSVPVKEMKK